MPLLIGPTLFKASLLLLLLMCLFLLPRVRQTQRVLTLLLRAAWVAVSVVVSVVVLAPTAALRTMPCGRRFSCPRRG